MKPCTIIFTMSYMSSFATRCNHTNDFATSKWNYIEEYETILFCMKSYEKPGKAYIALGTVTMFDPS